MAKFQTSFIPKKQTPVKDSEEKKRRGGLGLLGFGALIIFLLVLIGTGALYLYKIVVESNIERMSQSIARVQEAINPELIAELKDVDARIETAKILLTNRTVASPVFRILEDSTLASVGYTEFDFSIDDSGGPSLSTSGISRDYSSLALQSDVFGGIGEFSEPIFENLSLDQNGNVEFSFSTPIERSLILYENNLDMIPRFVGEDVSSGNPLGESDAQGTANETEDTTETVDDIDQGLDELLNELNAI